MSNLYVMLAIVGALILVALVLQGIWQARRARRTQGKSDGILLGGIEPVMGDESELSTATDAMSAAMASEPFVGLPQESAYAVFVDPLIDAVVTIVLDHPISGDTALQAAPSSRRAGSKPMYFEGFSKAAQMWEPLRPGEQYEQIQVGLQLANRLGALNEIEFSDFIMKMHNFADAIGGAFEAPDMIETVARAKELDQFAVDHDAQLSIYLVANKTAWSPAYLQQQAAPLGFVVGSMPGRLVIPAMQSGAPPVITMQYDMQAAMADDPNMMPVTHASLTLDVPQTDRLEQPFKQMYKACAALAKNLDASVVDEQGAPLGAEAFDAIHAMLENLYEQLERRGLPAGSVVARRLFS